MYDSNSDEQARMKVLKTNVLLYKNILEQAIDKFSPKGNTNNFDTYLKYKEIICDLVVDLKKEKKKRS